MGFYEAQLSEPLKEIRMYVTGSPPGVSIHDAFCCHLGLLHCFSGVYFCVHALQSVFLHLLR